MADASTWSPASTSGEAGRVEAWRLHVLIEAGYPTGLAELVAGRTDVDLHQAVELLRQGCLPETAIEILL